MSLIKYPEVYRTGIAISAISHWKKQMNFERDLGRFGNRYSSVFWENMLARADFATAEQYIDPLLRAAELKQPIYIMHGELDQVVDASEARVMLAALKKTNPKVESMSFPHATHTYWPLADRVAQLNEIESFLQRTLPPAGPVLAR
jgi:dipeptidyl aminopeptidase/acylaminoacyl peptidase